MIDAHHHLWTYDAERYPWIADGSPLHATFTPDDLEAVAKPHGVTGSVLVQAEQSAAGTDWLIATANSSDFIQVVIPWVPLHADDVGQTLDHLLDEPKVRGVRHVVQDEPVGFLLDETFNRGVRELTRVDLAYDILIYGRQLKETISFVDRHPQQRFVLDHIAKPTITAEAFDEDWARSFRELAKRRNVDCKVSGMATEVRDDTWSVSTLRPYWETALEAFGVERLMFGSDWPVALLGTKYGRWVDTAKELAGELSAEEQEQFFRRTAQRAYRL